MLSRLRKQFCPKLGQISRPRTSPMTRFFSKKFWQSFFIHLYNITKNEQNLRISLPQLSHFVRFSQKMALKSTILFNIILLYYVFYYGIPKSSIIEHVMTYSKMTIKRILLNFFSVKFVVRFCRKRFFKNLI